MMFSINRETIKNRKLGTLILDFVMIFIALVNVILIGFDYTYFIFRNFYFHNIPGIIEIYDPLKGIEPHRFTADYIQKADAFFNEFNKNNQVNEPLKKELDKLSTQMINEDPFTRANKSGELELVKERIRNLMKVESSKKAFSLFWQIDNDNFKKRYDFYKKKIKHVIETNYWRRIDTSGKFVDHFFYIDLSFIFIFMIEFIIMWIYSIKEFGPDQKVLFPIYRWYDILSFIPIKELRFLRLLRFVSAYYRLLRANIITVKKNSFIYVIIKEIIKYKGILEEELSDPITINILTSSQEKIKSGSNRDVIYGTIEPYRNEIKKVFVDNIKTFEHRIISENHQYIVDFVAEVLEKSIVELPQYNEVVRIPYFGNIVRKFSEKENIENFIDQYIQNVENSVEQTLKSETGDILLNNIVEDLLDQVLKTLREDLIMELTDNINIQVLEKLKEGTNRAKKWKVTENLNLEE